ETIRVPRRSRLAASSQSPCGSMAVWPLRLPSRQWLRRGTAPSRSTTEVTPTWISLASSPWPWGMCAGGTAAEAVGGQGGGGGRWVGRLVGAVEGEMGGVEVQAVAGQLGEANGLGGDGGEDGVALGEKGIEGASQAVIVEAIGGEVPKEVRPGVFGPGGDVEEGGGLAQPGGQEKAEDTAMREGELRVQADGGRWWWPCANAA